MYTIGMLGNYVSQGVYAVAAPFEGAVDVIVVQQGDGTFKSSPWYVRCSADYQGSRKEKIVDIWVNDVKADFCMVLNNKGEAYFETDEEMIPLSSSSADVSLSGCDSTLPSTERNPVLEEGQLLADTQGSILSQEGSLIQESEPVNVNQGVNIAGHQSSDLSAVDDLEKSFDPGIAHGQVLRLHGLDTENTRTGIIDTHSTSRISTEYRKTDDNQEVIAVKNKVDEVVEEAKCTLRLQASHVVEDETHIVIAKDWFASQKMPGIPPDADSAAIIDATAYELDWNECQVGTSDDKQENKKLDAQQPGSSMLISDSFVDEHAATENKEIISDDHLEDVHISSKEVICKVDEMITTEVSRDVAIPVIPIVPSSSRWWPLSFLKTRTDKIPLPESMLTQKTILPTSQIAVESPLANEILKNDDYHHQPQKKRRKSRIPTSDQIKSLKLKAGPNKVTFTFPRALGKAQVDANIYLWKWNARIVVSDVDGTITKSDVLGQVMPLVGRDWSQSGVTRLFSAIKENGYEVLFLSARAISQSYLTRRFLGNLKQDGEALPEGPVFISPDGLLPSLYREVIRRTPHEFKITCLEEIRKLFPRDVNPFYAGFGNRETDEISYRKVGIPKGKIFTINPKGEVMVNNHVHVKTYTSIHALVDGMFPPVSSSEQEDFNTWNYWKLPLPNVVDEISDSLKTRKGQRSKN